MLKRKLKGDKKKNQISKEKKQLDLDLPSSKIEFFFKLKRKFKRVEENFTAIPFWRNGLIWATITTVISVSIITTILIGKYYDKLPPDVPIIYDTYNERWDSYPKIFIFSIPVLLIVLGFLNVRLLQRVYFMNKKLTLMICIIMTGLYIFELIAVNEILLICIS